MKVRIKRVNKSLPLPDYQTEGAAGFDIYSRLDAEIPPGEYAALPINLVIETPKGYMLAVVARSSTYKKKGLIVVNAIGVIDSDFCGDEDETLVQLYNLSSKTAIIKKGERIAQGIFVKIDTADWNEVDKMDNKTRGGIGSTDDQKN